MSIREAIDAAPVSRFQARVIAICVVLNLVDGFDILVMAFAASGVATEWGLTASQIGLLLSSGLAGMALGSAFLAPIADRVGRRPLTLACLLVSTVGMALAAASPGFSALGLARLLTGLGIGGVVASLPVIISEYAPTSRRGTAMGLYAVGLPLGGVIGGSIAALLTTQLGWRSTFVTGAALTALMLVVVYAALPESLDYLLVRRPARALERINLLLTMMRLATIDELPAREAREAQGVRAGVLTGRQGVATALLWVTFFLLMAGFYFAASWTPRLLEQSGLSAQQSMNGGVLLNLGGVVATLAFAALALRLNTRLLTVLSLAAAGLSFLAVAFALGNLAAALIAAIAVGMFTNASAAGVFALAPGLYPTSVRTTAVGWAAALGRLGAIASPILAGLLVDGGWTPRQLFLLFAGTMIIAGVSVAVLTRGRADTESLVAAAAAPTIAAPPDEVAGPAIPRSQTEMRK